MQKNRFPSFRETLENFAVTNGSYRRALTKEQKDGQEELRSRPGNVELGSGIILPWLDTERRDMSATGGSTEQYGGAAVGVDVPEIGPALRAALVTARLGGRVIAGLRGDSNFPYGAGAVSAQWLTENGAGDDTAEVVSALSLTPKRVAAYLPVTKQLLLQGGPQFYTWLQAELLDLLAVEIDRVAIAGTGENNQPRGILYTTGIGAVVGGASGAAPTLTHLADLEYDVTGTSNAGRGPLGWITSPKVRRKLRLTASNGSGSPMIWPVDQDDTLFGLPAGVTTACPDTLARGSSGAVCSAIVFGNFRELITGLWYDGIAVDMVEDATYGAEGRVLVIVRAYVDCGVRQAKAFAAMLDCLAA